MITKEGKIVMGISFVLTVLLMSYLLYLIWTNDPFIWILAIIYIIVGVSIIVFLVIMVVLSLCLDKIKKIKNRNEEEDRPIF